MYFESLLTFDVLFAYFFLKVKYELLGLAGSDVISCPMLRRDSDVIADVMLYFDFIEVIVEYFVDVY